MELWGAFDSQVDGLFRETTSPSSSDTNSDSTMNDGINPAAEDDSWNISGFEQRVEGSSEWDASSRPPSVQRVQDLSLNLSIAGGQSVDRCESDKDKQSWPFDNSPCRMFGGKNTRATQKAVSFNNRSLFKGWFGRTDPTKMSTIEEASLQDQSSKSQSFCEEAVTPGRDPRSRGPLVSKSFDSSTYGMSRILATSDTVEHARPSVNRAMSIAPVRPPDSAVAAHPPASRSGRRRPRDDHSESSSEERPRQLLKLLRDKEAVSASDFEHIDNRRLLHQIVYQSQLSVSFQEMKAFLAKETARNDTDGHWERPELPMFVKD